MAVAIPIIAAFASGAVGAVVAGTATFGAYLTVAGAALSTLGAVTGKKDVTRVGALLSLGGGLANAFGGTSAAAEGVASEASSAWDAADSAAGSDAAQFGKYAQPAATPGIETAMEEAARAGAGEMASSAAGFDYPDAFSQAGSGDSIFSRAGVADRTAALESQVPGAMPGASDPLAEGAKSLTRNDLEALTLKTQREAAMPALQLGNMGSPGGAPLAQVSPVQAPGSGGLSLFEQAKQGINSLGANVRQNKELYQLAGSMLQSMYGPQAEQADMERSIMARRLRNLNSPVALTFGVR